MDLTVFPTAAGFWVPWFPLSLLQSWPFAYWIFVVLDHFSRKVIAVGVFRKAPTAAEICHVLDRAVRREGGPPKYTVSDQGSQFQSEFRAWCEKRDVKPRFGAVGKHGSIAVTERFIRTLKEEGLRRLPLVPLSVLAMCREVRAFARWYDTERPHSALDGATPAEVYFGQAPACKAKRFEPRARYPAKRRELRARRGTHLAVDVTAFEGRAHLPVVRIRVAA
jgi:transposase InsO family protein